MAERGSRLVGILKVGLAVAAIASYHLLPGVSDFVTNGIGFLRNHDFEGLRSFILNKGIWAPVASISLMTIQSLVPFVPGLAITLSNAWIFGWEYGALYSWIGALLGAGLDFGIARWYGRPFVEQLISPSHMEFTDRFFRRHGVLAVFITRLTPVIPFKVVSYCAGLTAVSVSQYLLATGIGQTPAILLYSYLGQHLARNVRGAMAVTSLLLLLGALAYFFRDSIEKRLFSRKDSDGP